MSWDNLRKTLYKVGRDFLLENGYEQISLRMFRKMKLSGIKTTSYCCQEDGMVGIGAGARSYTKAVHYSSEYAVGSRGVKGIIAEYISKSSDDFKFADYGVQLSQQEQKRRYMIKSLLHGQGLNIQKYKNLFGQDVLKDFPDLMTLISDQFLTEREDVLYLTPSGMEHSDAIGPWLYSENIKELIQQFDLR
jgi:oxygen-independent coproporphyrinogen-3 oxidase